jgi:hypothetical protein
LESEVTIKIGWAHSTHGETRSVYRILIGKPEENRKCGRPGHRREDNIKIGLRKIVLPVHLLYRSSVKIPGSGEIRWNNASTST